MNISLKAASAMAITALVGAVPAFATITVTQGTNAPTYENTLNFDEPNGPTGQNVASDSWTDLGVTELKSGEGSNFVGDLSVFPELAWAGGSNRYYGPFGVFMKLEQDATAASLQFWDSSGPGGPFGGGAAVVVLHNDVELTFQFISNPAWGGFGNSWFHIVGEDGMVFDEIRVLGFGFNPASIVDDISWQKVPTPGAAALFAVSGLAAMRRRRS